MPVPGCWWATVTGPSWGRSTGGGTLQIGVRSDPATTGVDLNTPQGVSDQFSGVIDGSGGLIAMVGLGSNTIGSINPDGTGTFDISVASGSVFVSNTLKVRQLNVFGVPGQIATFGGPSTMSVSDVATFNSSSTFNVALNGTGAGQSTQLEDTKSTGNPVSLGGSTLSVSLGYTPNAGDTFTIISAAGGITGQFSNITDGQILTVNNVSFRYNQTSTAATLTALQADDHHAGQLAQPQLDRPAGHLHRHRRRRGLGRHHRKRHLLRGNTALGTANLDGTARLPSPPPRSPWATPPSPRPITPPPTTSGPPAPRLHPDRRPVRDGHDPEELAQPGLVGRQVTFTATVKSCRHPGDDRHGHLLRRQHRAWAR